MKISKIVEDSYEDMVKQRREFHSHPESGWLTFYTTSKIANILKKYGFTLKMGKQIVDKDSRLGLGTKEQIDKAIKRAKLLLNDEELEYLDILEDGLTGVVGILDTNKQGPTTAFRFDIDGVDVTENKTPNHKPFKDGFNSDIDGITHACGHDGHTTIGLALAKIISENISDFKGKFVFIFQTGEEGCRGAVGMEPTGFLDGVDYLFGMHIGFQAKKSEGIICGVTKFLATSKFDVYFKGVSAHASGEPQNGANALLAGANAATQMHAITRHADGASRINVGVLRAGEGRNVIAPNAYMACETRGESTDINDFMRKKCYDIVQGVAKIHSVDYKIVQTGGTSGGDSSKFITDIVQEASLQSPFIKNELIEYESEFKACEDFAHFMRKVQLDGGKSGYAMIGTNLAAGHHNECFDFDENSLKGGLDIFLRVAYKLNS